MGKNFKRERLGKLKLSHQGYSSIKVIIWLLAIVVGLGVSMYTTRSHTPKNGFSPQPNISTSAPVEPPNQQAEFDIEAFYSKLQNGMNPDEVNKLAGKQPDDCVRTDSEPPHEACYWYSGNKTVYVSYGQKSAVEAKSKTGF